MTSKIKYTIITTFIIFKSFFTIAQPGQDDIPCDAKQLSEFSQIVDSFEFRVNCFTRIDLDNEMCNWVISEGNYNTVPNESSKVLFIIYFEGEINPKQIECLKLFDSSKYRRKFLDKIQLIFVYDQQNGYTATFDSKETISNLLNYNIRNGFKE